MERVTWTFFSTICEIGSQWEFAMTQGTLTGALGQSRSVGWRGRWEGGLGERGHGCTYG